MGVSGHTVRLGIEAPGGISIYREEIWLAVKEENRAAADALPASPPTGGEASDPGADPGAPEAGAKGGEETPPRTA